MANIEIKPDNEKEILAQIQRLQADFDDRINLMRKISDPVHSALMRNFDAGDRSAWQGLKYRAGVLLSDTFLSYLCGSEPVSSLYKCMTCFLSCLCGSERLTSA